jgi:L-seryl-tRNA(Ser) seleniumtransferase
VAAGERLARRELRAAVARAQQRARAGEIPPEAVPDVAAATLPKHATALRPIVNASGVLLHTNLGRAPLSAAARDALLVAAGYVDVEYDVHTGVRAARGRTALAALQALVPAAEDALVVNNGAAAVLLAVTAVAAGKEILVSRGELVEIGDGFRLPDLMVSTGARLREVGTTNRTRLADYADAVGPDTALVLKVHPSNFVVQGFVSTVAVDELRTLGLPVVADLGSGLLGPDPLLPDEPDVGTTLRRGADVVTVSGDKLLGGPQAGLVFGRSALLQQMRRHPLARALRVDKLTIAALEATLRGPAPPLSVALRAYVGDLRQRAEALAERLTRHGVDAVAVDSDATVGGGGAPGVVLPSAAVSLPLRFLDALRRGEPAVVGRADAHRCLLDLRAVPTNCDDVLFAAVLAAR